MILKTYKKKLNIAISFLNELEKEIKSNIIEFEGTKEFYSYPVLDIFKEKTLLIPKDKGINIEQIVDDWFVFEKFYGTSEEKQLIELINKIIDDIRDNYRDIYLIRNERHFALYDFKEGRRFEPDFVLLSKNKNNNCNYQFFIEPKGEHLKLLDKWKEDFLLDIEENYKAYTNIKNQTTYTNKEYKIIGLEFYNQANENEFKDSLVKCLQLNNQG